MGQTLGPYDPSKPDGGLIIVDLIPEPIREAQTEFLINAACDIAGKMESGYRFLGLPALANQLSVARANASCYTGSPPSFEASQSSPPFVGGQCAGVAYEADIEANRSGNIPISYVGTNMIGPIAEFRPIPTGTGPYTAEYRRVGESSFQQVQGSPSTGGSPITSITIVGPLRRVDGQPDTCGDPPYDVTVDWPDGVELPSPPSPGDVLVPNQIVDVTVDVNGVPSVVSVEVGDVVFSPDVGVEFTVGDLSYTLSPSFTLSFELPGEGGDVSRVEEIVEEIREEVTQQIAGSLGAQSCSAEVVAAEYSGAGLRGLQDLGSKLLQVLSSLLLEQCPVDAEVNQALNRVEVGSGTAGLNDVTYVSVGVKSRIVCLEVEGLPPDLRVYKLAGDDLEAPFGYMCLTEGSGSDTFNGPAVDVKTRQTRYDVGRDRGFDRAIRLSLRRGLEWTLYSLEVP